MNVNIMNLLLAKTVAEQQGVPAQRAFEIGLVSSMLPGWTGLMLAIVAAKNEAPKKVPAPTPEPQPRPDDPTGVVHGRTLPGATAK